MRPLEVPVGLAVALIGDGVCVELHVRPHQKDGRAFAHEGPVAVEYRCPAGRSPSPAELALVREAAGIVLGPAFGELATALDPRQLVYEEIGGINVIDLVRRGLKPTAIVSAPLGKEPPTEELICLTAKWRVFEDVRGKVHADPAGRVVSYVGRDRASVERLRQLDEEIVTTRGPGRRQHRLIAEQGRLLGYPECCVERYSRQRFAPRRADETYTYLRRLRWHRRAIDGRLGFPLAQLWRAPLLSHVPCGAGCTATMRLAEKVLALYSDAARAVLLELLSLGLVVWSDGHVVPFRPLDAAGRVREVEDFGQWPHRPLLSEAAFVRMPVRVGVEPAVYAIRSGIGKLEVRAHDRWLPYRSKIGLARLTRGPAVVIFHGP